MLQWLHKQKNYIRAALGAPAVFCQRCILSIWSQQRASNWTTRSQNPKTRITHFLMVPLSTTVPSSRPYFLMTLRSWSMSNSSVASLPANIMMLFLPPGCSPRSSWQGQNRNGDHYRYKRYMFVLRLPLKKFVTSST